MDEGVSHQVAPRREHFVAVVAREGLTAVVHPSMFVQVGAPREGFEANGTYVRPDS